MPELTSPWWLAGLALVPLVRWLHRFHSGERLVRVPALFLWRQATVDAAQGTRRSEPDPAWRRRALLVALLVLALAGPQWQRQATLVIQVWLDDRPSLFSREADGKTRLDLAATALSQALTEAHVDQVRLHALARPGEVRDLPATDLATVAEGLHDWLDGPGTGPRPRTLPQPPPGTHRWLLSDGVRAPDPALFPFHRTIGIGRNTENLALIRLAVRPSLDDPDRLLGLVAALNAGHAPASTRLEIALNEEVQAGWTLDLAPGEQVRRGFGLDRQARGTLTASLFPTARDPYPDALSTDDLLVLELDERVRRVPVAVAGDCGRAVIAVLQAHPGLRLHADTDARLQLWCATGPPAPADTPVLRLFQGTTGEPPGDIPTWEFPLPEKAPALKAAWIRPYPTKPSTGARPLLRAGERVLIAQTQTPHRIEVLFDLDAPALAVRPELPLLLSFLMERLAGSDLLYPSTADTRDPTSVAVAPQPLPAYHADYETGASEIQAAPFLITAALVLLLFDVYLLLAAGRRLRGFVSPGH